MGKLSCQVESFFALESGVVSISMYMKVMEKLKVIQRQTLKTLA